MVLVIVCIALAIVAPNLRGFWSARRHENAATQVLSLTQWARTKAITDAMICRLTINSADGTFQLSIMDESGQFVPIEADFGQLFEMPENTRIEMTRGDNSGVDYVDFYPSGRVDPAIIRITTLGEQEIQIVSESATEPFRIAGEAEERSR